MPHPESGRIQAKIRSPIYDPVLFSPRGKNRRKNELIRYPEKIVYIT